MARARHVQDSNPGQLTLDDWAEVLKTSSATPDAQRRPTASDDPAGVAENSSEKRSTRAKTAARGLVGQHSEVKELLETPGALLTRTHLRELGLERRAIDAVFRKLPVVSVPGYSRPMVHVEQYLELIRENTYRDDRVRSNHA
jgi:hypothetical protein